VQLIETEAAQDQAQAQLFLKTDFLQVYIVFEQDRLHLNKTRKHNNQGIA